MNLPQPALQIAFGVLLEGARKTVLREALFDTVGQLLIPAVDAELANIVGGTSLAVLAKRSLRGEAVFPVPCILIAKPSLIGYYRLLYGYSQKIFYSKKTGCGRFRTMESRGKLTPLARDGLVELCEAFALQGSALLDGLDANLEKPDILHELALLTLGAQYRGGANNDRGSAGIKAIFETIRIIVGDAIDTAGDNSIEILNAANRRVSINVSADPDILIRSYLSATKTRPIVAIEVKAGEDQSNIHNRIGEAEKSHLKARASGVTECWTIINVPNANLVKLHQESKSTDRFYQLLELTDHGSQDFKDFRDRFRDLVGLA